MTEIQVQILNTIEQSINDQLKQKGSNGFIKRSRGNMFKVFSGLDGDFDYEKSVPFAFKLKDNVFEILQIKE